KTMPWFYVQYSGGPTLFNWHAEKFEIPYGAISLASSEASKNQAFAIGRDVLAVQFHVETSPEDVRHLLENARADVVPGNFVQDETSLLGDSAPAERQRLCNQLLTHFFD